MKWVFLLFDSLDSFTLIHVQSFSSLNYNLSVEVRLVIKSCSQCFPFNFFPLLLDRNEKWRNVLQTCTLLCIFLFKLDGRNHFYTSCTFNANKSCEIYMHGLLLEWIGILMFRRTKSVTTLYLCEMFLRNFWWFFCDLWARFIVVLISSKCWLLSGSIRNIRGSLLGISRRYQIAPPRPCRPIAYRVS